MRWRATMRSCAPRSSDHRGIVVKMIGDGVHAAFDDPLDAVRATLQLQRALADPAATDGIALRVRCGLHAGAVERRDNDYFGNAVNRAARIMSAAHGGQILLSQAVVAAIRERLPEGVTLRDLGCGAAARSRRVPSTSTRSCIRDLRQDFPALRSLEATPNNLPQQVTSFVGRERELAEVKKLLGTTPTPDLARDGRPRQDAALAAGGRRRDGRLPGRRVVCRTGARRRCAPRAAGGRLRAGRDGRSRAARCSKRS